MCGFAAIRGGNAVAKTDRFTIKVVACSPMSHGNLPIITDDGNTNKMYAIAPPGSSFRVHVFRGKHAWSEFDYVQATLTIDGREVGYTNILKPGDGATFHGFAKTGTSDGSVAFETFKFAHAAPFSSADTPLPLTVAGMMGALKKPGSIQVSFRPVKPVGGHVVFHHTPIGGNTAVPPLPGPPRVPNTTAFDDNGKPFAVPIAFSNHLFRTPSLVTSTAGTVRPPIAWTYTQFDTISDNTLTCQLQYETASALMLHKVLNPYDVRHAYIIHKFGDIASKIMLEHACNVLLPAATQVPDGVSFTVHSQKMNQQQQKQQQKRGHEAATVAMGMGAASTATEPNKKRRLLREYAVSSA